MKKIFLFLLFLPIYLAGQSDYIQSRKHTDGPANIRIEPNGKVLFILNDYVDIHLHGNINDWYEIGVRSFVKKEDLSEVKKKGNRGVYGKLKKGSFLYDHRGKTIGKTIESLKVSADLLIGDLYRTGFLGYTFESNIRENISAQEILKHKESSFEGFELEGCENSKLTYRDDWGWPVEIIEECKFEEKEIIFDGQKRKALLKIKQNITRHLGVEGNGHESKFTIDLIDDIKKIEPINFYADEIEVQGEKIKATKHGGCGSDGEIFYIHLRTGAEVKI